ncbi:MAG: NAD(P)/FAD-dependent oxidoreductase [Deltaproteobacteria bacterium]|nr:NAD(P)/FAD-dependent oxidoreductase [Deltaproteobacteria bacterium]
MSTVLILGGGVGGVVAAGTLRKLLPKEHRIIVVDREQNHLFAPSLLWLMIGDRKSQKIARPLARLNRKGIEFVQGETESIDPEKKSVRVSGRELARELAADALIVSLGADLVPQAIPGLKEAGQNIYTLDGAESISRSLSSFAGGKIVVLTAAPAYKCPAAPYEAAMLIDYHLKRLGVRAKTRIDLYAAEPAPMGTAGPEVSAGVRQMVESKSIQYFPNHQVTEVDAVSRRIKFANGVNADFDLLFYVPPHRAPEVVKNAGLLSESGWVSVDRHTLETKFKGVYAIGDVTAIPLKMGKPLPKAGVFAHGQAEVVARNIAAEWTARGEKHRFDGVGQCFIETGGHRAGIGKGNFYAEPTPQVAIKQPAIRWHLAKILFEKQWLWKWF